MDIIWKGCHANNYGKGRDGHLINKIILHWIVGTLESADATFNKSDRKASAHYGIGNNQIHQYVQESDTAWHAGNLTVNKESIGIEHQGGPDLPISEETVKTSIELVTDICKRYNISPDKDHIKRHSDIKATQCPGTLPLERIIEEVRKNLITIDPTQTDTGRALLALERFRVVENHGNLEGAVNALVGAYNESQTLRNERDQLKNELKDRDSFIAGQKTAIGELQDQQKKVAELLGIANDFVTIKGEIEKLVQVETELDTLRKQYEELKKKLEGKKKSFWEKLADLFY